MTFRRWKLVRPCAPRPSGLARILLAAALGAATACGSSAVDGPGGLAPDDPNDALESAPPPIEIAPLAVRTYDGSGEFVHPDAFVFHTAWHGRRFWFAATPYPGGRIELENPSIYHATSATTWEAPPGVANPLARPADRTSYLSDPELQHDPVLDELRLYFRQTTGSGDQLLLTTSGDGRHWSTPRLMMAGRRYSLISPAIVHRPASGWRMWTVDAGSDGCRARAADLALVERRSADGVEWGTPAPVALRIPGYVPWHWDVQYVAAKHEYWTVVAAYPDGMNCSFTSLFFGRSTDGTTWRMSPSPIIAPGSIAPIRNVVYRSTFHYHERMDAITVWFSGARLEGGVYVYGGAVARYPMADLLQRVERSFDVPASVRRTRVVNATHSDSVARAGFVDAFP